jgi:hypothetical protein
VLRGWKLNANSRQLEQADTRLGSCHYKRAFACSLAPGSQVSQLTSGA